MNTDGNGSLSMLDIKAFLEEKTNKYNQSGFVATDPVLVPRQFSQKEDIEISAFLTATIAWGNRASIIKNALKLMHLLEYRPFDFLNDAPPSEYARFTAFTHRTFNGTDCLHLVQSLKNIYIRHGGLQQVCENAFVKNGTVKYALAALHAKVFEIPGERTRKHIANVEKGASAKRLNMFLRWMVRTDNRGVDFGLWPDIPASALMLPLDVHSGNVARKLGLLKRRQNDWKAVEEVTKTLRVFDPADPVKYDFALFGLGIFERF